MKIAALLLVALVAPSLPAAAAAPSPATSVQAARLDDRVTLNLADASLKDVLQRVAELLGVTPIFYPGLESLKSVTLDVRSLPIRDILHELEKSHGLSILVTNDRMVVSRAGAAGRFRLEKLDDEAFDREILADASLPQRKQGPPPRPPRRLMEFRSAGPGQPSAVLLLESRPHRVTLPGCSGPTTLIALPRDSFDGIRRLAIKNESSGGPPARIVTPGQRDGEPGRPFRLPECAFDLTVAEGGSVGEPAAAVPPVASAGTYLVTLRLIEVGNYGETAWAGPMEFEGRLDESFLARWGAANPRTIESGKHLVTGVQIGGAVLEMSDTNASVALWVTVTRDVAGPQGEVVTVRAARVEQSLRVDLGQPQRLTVSPTYGRGRSALVLELTVERAPLTE